MLSTTMAHAAANSSIARGRSRAPEVPTIRAIAFQSGGYEFALPMAVVVKVTHCPPLQSTEWQRAGLVYVDRQLIQVMDLGLLLGSADRPLELTDQFLAIARAGSALCGIPTDRPPDSIDLPRDRVQPLPAQFERSPLSRLAECAVVLAPDSAPRTIFLLNLRQALAWANEVAHPPRPGNLGFSGILET